MWHLQKILGKNRIFFWSKRNVVRKISTKIHIIYNHGQTKKKKFWPKIEISKFWPKNTNVVEKQKVWSEIEILC